ncbi:MAG: hypothetical protein KBD54_02645 [Candidatus Pacebacteria bacterium]|nr:hypothetical protein [Candidatus Paceibacterota bacterium]
MKKIYISSIVLASVLIPIHYVGAIHFSCSDIVTQTTSATVQVQSTAINTEFVRILKSTTPRYSDALYSTDSTLVPPDKKIEVFENLEPSSTYRGIVFDGQGDFVEEIKGCTLTTKASAQTAPVPASGGYLIESIPDASLARVRVVVRSQLPVQTVGRIELSGADGARVPCVNFTFPSGQPSDQCTFIQMTPRTAYTVTVIGTDASGQEYRSTSKFTMDAPTATPTPTTGSSGTPAPQTTTPRPSTGSSGIPAPGSGTYTPTQNQGSGFKLDIRLQNPLKVNTIQDAVKFFVNTLVKIAIPFIVIFFIWAGFKFILAQGNPTKVGEAKKMFWYTIIGTLLILGAWTITNAIIGTVNSIIS